MHLRGSGRRRAAAQLGQIFLTLVFLPYDAFISLDAIGRTLLRLLITRKRLLEWQTSSDAERDGPRRSRRLLCDHVDRAGGRAGWAGFCWSWLQPAQLPLALPFLGLWLAAPWIAWRISQPIAAPTPELDGRATDLPAPHRAQDLAFFRNLRHRAGELAAAG